LIIKSFIDKMAFSALPITSATTDALYFMSIFTKKFDMNLF